MFPNWRAIRRALSSRGARLLPSRASICEAINHSGSKKGPRKPPILTGDVS